MTVRKMQNYTGQYKGNEFYSNNNLSSICI